MGVNQLAFGFLLCAGCLQAIFAGSFDYSSLSGKGPSTWPTLFPDYCNKSSQSPINIVVKNTNYDDSLGSITRTGYSTIPSGPTMQVTNNGHSYSIKPKAGAFSISGGKLPGTQILYSFHFHWGSDNTKGSEHTIDGKRYPAEMHMVHFNSKYGNLSNALKYSDGLAVLSVLLEVGSENAALQSFLQHTANVTEPKTVYNLTQTHRLSDLLPVNTSHFYRYDGSLTTPHCNQVVTWTIFKNAASISTAQLALLRGLKENNVTAIVNNYRPVQDLNRRTIKFTYKPPVDGPDNGAHHVTNTLTTILALIMAALFKLI